MKLFVTGRKDAISFLEQWERPSGNWLWFHCASLGEFEQAVPLMEQLKRDYCIFCTFFSPSGYEQKKQHPLIDQSLYLPIDTPINARNFVDKLQPKAALFIKYDLWDNYFSVLDKNTIPIYLVSATFRKDQIYFKWYGRFFKNTLKKITYFFVQNTPSRDVLLAHNFTNVSVSGDTRFDRVYAQLSMDNYVAFAEKFIQQRKCIILGSTWAEDEAIFVKTINSSLTNVCFIIAPHEIKPDKITQLKEKINAEVSVLSTGISNKSSVLIVDAIGYLTKLYKYADIAYVGGAAGTTGLHNILEPAVFGLPILTGVHTQKFPEAQALEEANGLVKVKNAAQCQAQFLKFLENDALREKMGQNSAEFIKANTGATSRILKKLGL